MVFGNETNSEKFAIIDTKTDKTLFVTFEEIKSQILEKLGKTKETFTIKSKFFRLCTRSTTILRNE